MGENVDFQIFDLLNIFWVYPHSKNSIGPQLGKRWGCEQFLSLCIEVAVADEWSQDARLLWRFGAFPHFVNPPVPPRLHRLSPFCSGGSRSVLPWCSFQHHVKSKKKKKRVLRADCGVVANLTVVSFSAGLLPTCVLFFLRLEVLSFRGLMQWQRKIFCN